LGHDELPTRRLRAALEELGPVFAGFGRYLSSRFDLLPRRDCLDLAVTDQRASGGHAPVANAEALAIERLGDAPGIFAAFDPHPCAVTPWTQQHQARLPTGEPVVVTLVRPDADAVLGIDIPLLSLIAPWLDTPADDVATAVDDFAAALRRRLDQRQQAAGLIILLEDAGGGGLLDAPACHQEYCATGVLTVDQVDGVSLAGVVDLDADRPAHADLDRDAIARQLATAWVRQLTAGRVVPFDFDLGDLRLRGERLVLIGGALEPISTKSRSQFFDYLMAAAADDPDRAWTWIAEAALPRLEGHDGAALRRRIRQVVPFRDGEWSGNHRIAEYVLAHWRATREARWNTLSHQLHLYRGIHAISHATARLRPHGDSLLEALQTETLRLGLSDAQRLLESGRLPTSLATLARDLSQVPQRLDDLLTMVAAGRLRIKAEVPDGGERREARNRTVSLVASLVALVAVTFLMRHLGPTLGPGLEWLSAVLVLVVGGWLLAAAARL